MSLIFPVHITTPEEAQEFILGPNTEPEAHAGRGNHE